MQIWMRIWILLAAFLATSSPALAQDGSAHDCRVDGYLNQFEDAPTPLELACHVEFSVPVTIGGATRNIRVISDDNAASPPNAAMISALRRGVDGAARVLGALTNSDIQDVTILLYDGLGQPDIHGNPVQARTLDSATRPECNITFYGGYDFESTSEVAVTAAHEIFHCMQYATLTAAQMNTYGGGGTWWIEGAAEALADRAVPDAGGVTDRSDDFAAAVQREVAVNHMEHESVPFFQWLIGANGLQSAVDFQHAMAGGNAASAQHAAMRGSGVDWTAFAKAYADNQITTANGAGLNTPAPDVSLMDFSETQDWTVTRAPFVLNVGRVNYHCGQWQNALTPAGFAALKIGGAWADWPEQFENFDETLTPMAFVALNTGGVAGPHRLTATLETPCGACGETTALDSCLVGRWVLTAGGPAEWIRANGMGGHAQLDVSEMSMQMLRNGRFVTGGIDVAIESNNDGMVITGDGVGTGAGGKWSAAEGVLNICPQTGEVTATVRAEASSQTMMFGPGGDMQMSYTCAGGTLNTVLEIGHGIPPMPSEYTRQ